MKTYKIHRYSAFAVLVGCVISLLSISIKADGANVSHNISWVFQSFNVFPNLGRANHNLLAGDDLEFISGRGVEHHQGGFGP